jgi:hypothetical protein
MHDSAHFQSLVDAAVRQAFDDVRADTTMRVMQAIAPALAPRNDIQRLATAQRTIETVYGQPEILSALVQGCGSFAARCALFVVRGVSAPVWQSHGFDATAVRGVTAQVGSGLGATAMQSLGRAEGKAEEFDSHFLSVVGPPANGMCVVFPLMVREKVAALVYADGGQSGDCDADALEILVCAAGNRIEIAATRKAPVQTMAATATVSASGPAIHPHPPVAPAHASAPAAASPMAAATAPAPAHIAVPAVAYTPAPVAHAHLSEPVQHAAPAQPQAPVDEVHVKARRFAKLLVEEIKLYNQNEVTAGRQSGDLYTRLREPIDKSRDAYEKRYGNTPAAGGNYFAHELVRILADNNIALMGANFPR